jgi:DNA sulfur modification protein DndD
MEIKLVRWSCTGFRCPDMDIDLTRAGEIPRVSLIQMPNGTGKTTTLALLKATLTGKAREWTAHEIAELRHPVDRQDSGRFVVELSVDGKPLRIELICAFDEGVASFNTTSPEMGGFNKDWSPPPSVRRFLTDRFVNLFIFDGELANALLDSSKTKAEEAIETLSQLDLLDSVIRDCESFWERSTAKMGARNEKGLARYKAIAAKLDEQIKFLKGKAKQKETRLSVVKGEILRLKTEIQRLVDEDGKNREMWHNKRAAKIEKEQALTGALRELMERMRRPEALTAIFGTALRSIKANLDIAKLPDSTSRQFFQELALQPECVCGRPIGEDQRVTILARADHFLGEDLAGVLNAFKQEVDLIDPDEQRRVVDERVAQVQTIRAEIAGIQADMDLIEKSSVSAAGGNPEEFRQKLGPLELEEKTLEGELGMLRGPTTASDSELITSSAEAADIVVIASAEKQLKLANDEINRINGTLELRMRLDLLKKICVDARDLAKQKIKEILVERCNKRLLTVLKGDPLQIARIDRSIVLRDRESGSTGQNLAVGYTFLAEALSKGSHDFPLVVDSPAGPLDHGVRREIAAMVPKLCTQFVAFTISTEREAFLEPLEAGAKTEINFVTVFRKTPGNADLLKDLPPHHSDNGHSIIVSGRDYFTRFALEDERDEGVQ